MQIKGSRDYLFGLESVAMTDIVMNLFIFFFISFSLVYTFNPSRVHKMEVKLPKAQNVKALSESEQIDIILTSEGPLYLDEELVTFKNLSAKVKRKMEKNANLGVVIRSDRLVPFKDIVKVLDIVSGLGLSKISIAAIKE